MSVIRGRRRRCAEEKFKLAKIISPAMGKRKAHNQYIHEYIYTRLDVKFLHLIFIVQIADGKKGSTWCFVSSSSLLLLFQCYFIHHSIFASLCFSLSYVHINIYGNFLHVTFVVNRVNASVIRTLSLSLL